MAAGKYPGRARVVAALPLRTALVVALMAVAVLAFGAPPAAAQAQTGDAVVAWGDNERGQTDVPAGLGSVTDIAAGYDHSLALKEDGTVVAWGRNLDGQTDVPSNLGSAMAIAGGGSHSMAIGVVSSPPVAVDDAYDVDEDVKLDIAAPGVLGNDTDANNDPLTAVVVDDVHHGALTLDLNGSFTYIPDSNFNGSDSFTYKANDGSLDSNVATVSITIGAVNDAPVAEDDSATTDEDTPANINVVTNDTDVDGDSLSVSTFAQPSNGTVTKNAEGTLEYAPNTDFHGTDSFTYEACDEGDPALCGTGVTMTVTPVPGACTIRGTGKDDVLRGTAGRDVICGGGNDTFYGRGGNDLIRGGTGKDTVHGDAGDDTLMGGDGRDRLYGEAGDDRLFGGAGTDLLDGGSGVNFTQQ